MLFILVKLILVGTMSWLENFSNKNKKNEEKKKTLVIFTASAERASCLPGN